MINLEKAKKVLSSLEKRGLTLGSVESLTAGLFASTICSVPGASKVFKGSFVTYATSMKTDFLNINKAFINKYGVVSKEVAREMAIIGRHGLEVDVCVSFTGNAGPTKEKGKAPVGRPGPSTPWGKPALGYKTRGKKDSDKLIVRRRGGKK